MEIRLELSPEEMAEAVRLYLVKHRTELSNFKHVWSKWSSSQDFVLSDEPKPPKDK